MFIFILCTLYLLLNISTQVILKMLIVFQIFEPYKTNFFKTYYLDISAE